MKLWKSVFAVLAALLLVGAVQPATASLPPLFGGGSALAKLQTPPDLLKWKSDGLWGVTGDWFSTTGDPNWRCIQTGNAKWKDYQVDLSLRIDKATDRRNPRWEAGGWVWASYRNDVNIAGHEAGIVLRKGEKDYYRVMFSIPFQEVMLWSTKGGFLQVIPTKLDAGTVYQVSAAAQGPHITVSMDGKAVIDYWDRTAPLLTGGVALGVHEGAVSFSKVTVNALPAFTGAVPPHKADFHFRDWKGARWAWDGNEPIFLAGTDCNGHEVKLVPGYKPQLMIYWHWLNYGDEAFYCDKLKAFNIIGEGDTLHFEVVATDNKEKTWLTSRCEVTVRYDAAQNRYLYDQTSDLTLPEGHTLRVNHPLEFTDPCIHGHVGSASPQTTTWDTPHPWSVYKHVSGALQKHPHNHYSWYPGWGKPAWQEAKGNNLDPNGGFWALVGDPVANPVLSIQSSSVKDSTFYTELCGWAYDVHMRWYPVKSGQTLQPGIYTVKWQMTSVDGKQGDTWLQQATFCAPEDLEKKLLLYTAGIGHVEKFDTTAKWASPFYTYPLGDASLQDTTTGHTDKTSLKIDGPRSAASMVGGSVYSDPVLENTSYEVTAWVKTKDVQGEGPGIIFGGQPYYPLITGTTDWQKIGFVCRPGQPLHTVPFTLTNSGSGTVWFDDFQIRPLKKDEQPAAPVAPAVKPIANPEASKDQLLAWTGKSAANDPGRTLLDLSLHGNHGRLEGTAALVDDGGKQVLDISGDKGYVTTNTEFTFKPPQTIAIWVKPGKLTNDWNMVFTGGAWNRAWQLFLYYKQSPYSIDFRAGGKRLFTDGVVPMDKWTHLAVTDDGKTITIYVNGEKKKEDVSAGNPWPSVPGPLVLGTWVYYEKPRSSYTGRLADPILYNRALAAEEVKALFDKGVQ
ncbi:MAG TPA: LamG domain-containing protein [Armatimonadota bacterium]